MRYKSSESNYTTDVFALLTARMHQVVVAQFFQAICSIFDHLLAVGFNNNGLLGPVSMYFGKIETNSQGILYLHCLV